MLTRPVGGLCHNAPLHPGYFYFVASHRHKPDLIDQYPRLLLERSVELGRGGRR